ncbi:hypothetical protein M409DRAFT_17433 [Zasmidium cellare ATCC 36951]|uniref:Uncharacterized protein n=1 Tax=Zasmidium cellare ATCC 36951 TaxID=1080233 RepID=A0A6A6CZL1_ZASCE|nr:uncharacterized protein M409DRAFT_17433 [Zasmidium cellare ATCC 36951]KAF2172193.1 hypothetical protein M409DRAFT_17433 [Zasmidium cellare ATCC 36951]
MSVRPTSNMNTTRSRSGRIRRYLVAIAVALLLAVLFRGYPQSQTEHVLDSNRFPPHHKIQNELQGHGFHDSPLQHLKRQGGSDEDDEEDEWAKCAKKGCRLNELMGKSNADLQSKDRSSWINFDDIKKYGWSLSDQEDKVGPNDDDRASSAPLLQALGIPGLDDPSWKKVPWVHVTESKVDGKTYPPTKGEHINFYNPTHGIIIAANNRSPLQKNGDIPRERVIPLRRWSDLAYLTWLDVCRQHHQDPKNLKYILRMNVFSDDVQDILPRVIGKSLVDLTESYPGISVDGMLRSENARAAIGFSNGRGVAWLLIQHKETFGDKKFIKAINIWDSYNAHRPAKLMPGLDEIPNVLFTIS